MRAGAGVIDQNRRVDGMRNGARDNEEINGAVSAGIAVRSDKDAAGKIEPPGVSKLLGRHVEIAPEDGRAVHGSDGLADAEQGFSVVRRQPFGHPEVNTAKYHASLEDAMERRELGSVPFPLQPSALVV